MHILGGSGAYASSPRRNCEVRFSIYFDQCVLKNSLKISNFYIKNNYYIHVGTHLLWGTYSVR